MTWSYEGGKQASQINVKLDLVCFEVSVQNNGTCFYFHGKKRSSTSHHLVVRTPKFTQDSVAFSELLSSLTVCPVDPNDTVLFTEKDLREAVRGTQIVASCHTPDRSSGERGVCLVLEFFLNMDNKRWITPHDNSKRNIIPICMLPDFDITPAAPKKNLKDLLSKRRAELKNYEAKQKEEVDNAR